MQRGWEDSVRIVFRLLQVIYVSLLGGKRLGSYYGECYGCLGEGIVYGWGYSNSIYMEYTASPIIQCS